VPLEVGLVEGHVLERDDLVVGELEDAVDQEERIPMREQTQDLLGLHHYTRADIRHDVGSTTR
jgi:hypothetical protein